MIYPSHICGCLLSFKIKSSEIIIIQSRDTVQYQNPETDLDGKVTQIIQMITISQAGNLPRKTLRTPSVEKRWYMTERVTDMAQLHRPGSGRNFFYPVLPVKAVLSLN